MRVDVDADGCEVTVLDGAVDFGTADGIVTVPAGQCIRYPKSELPR
jgi:hypothetical protein